MNRSIIPVSAIQGEMTLPGSKYIANRVLPIAALANSKSKLTQVVDNDDIQIAMAGLGQLGYQLIQADPMQVWVNASEKSLKTSNSANPVTRMAIINTGHSGTFSRFIVAIAALEQRPVRVECSAKMATRPMAPLFKALTELGANIDCTNGCLPVTIEGPLTGSFCKIDASQSSQFLSALLIIAPYLKKGLTIETESKIVSRAYVDMTIQLMRKFGVNVEQRDNRFIIAPGQKYQGQNFVIPADPVSTSYFLGAAVISGGSIRINHFDFQSVQGEAKFYQILEAMGARVEISESCLSVSATEQLNGITVDMGNMPDVVQTLAVVAAYANGVTHMTNIEHLAYKESDRIKDTAIELRKAGIKVEFGKDFLKIWGGTPTAAVIDTHDDHRMAMSMALLGIKTPGICIRDSHVVSKSFPLYWDYLARLGISSEVIE